MIPCRSSIARWIAFGLQDSDHGPLLEDYLLRNVSWAASDDGIDGGPSRSTRVQCRFHPVGAKVLHEEHGRDDRKWHTGASYLFFDLELAVEMRNARRPVGTGDRRIHDMRDARA